MGTLLNQPVRKWMDYDEREITNFIEDVQKIAKKSKLSVDQVLKIYEIKELQRKNNLAVSNGDIYDEQMSGFGELFTKLIESLDGLANAIEQQ